MSRWKQFALVALGGSLVPIGTIALYLSLSRDSQAARTSSIAAQEAPAPSPSVTPSPRAAASALAVPVPARRVDVLAQARELVTEKASSLETEKDVDKFLDQLESQARTRGEVSAMDVEPGFMAIADLAPQIGPEKAAEKRGMFAHQMSQLAVRLRGTSAEKPEDLVVLGQRIRATEDAEARNALVNRYAEAVSKLPDEDRLAELPKLREFSLEANQR